MVWSTGGKTTLSGTADTITVNNISDGEFLMALNHIITSGNVSVKQTFNNDTTANNYGYRISDNGTTDVAGTAPNNYWYKSFDYDKFTVSYICNISGKEKLSINFTAEQDGTGKTVPPERREGIAKWANTTDSITRIDVFNSETGDYLTGSNLTVLNGDTTEETILGNNVQSGSRFEATDTRKIYYGILPSVTYETDFSSSTGWTQVGTAMTIDTVTDQRVEFTNLPRNAEHKVYYNLGSAVSDSNWILDFKVNISSSSTSGNGGVWIGLVDSSNEIHTGSVDGLLINFFDNNVGGTEMRMRSVEYNAGALTVSSNSNTLSLSTDYFVRAIRTSATNIDFGIYTDEARTAQVGSTISKTINASTGSLDVVQITSQSVGDVGTVSGIVDDLKVYDGVTSTDFTWTEEV